MMIGLQGHRRTSWNNVDIRVSACIRILLSVLLLSLFHAEAHSDEQLLAEHLMELSSPRFQVKVLKSTLPKGYRSAEHIHEKPGPRYVIKGRIRVLIGDDVEEYGPGEVFFELEGNFKAENISTGEVDLLVVEMIPEALPEKPPSPVTRKKKGSK